MTCGQKQERPFVKLSRPTDDALQPLPLPESAGVFCVLHTQRTRRVAKHSNKTAIDILYGGMDEPELKIIDVFICKLRKKLSEATGRENHIETVWGRGYVLRDPKPDDAAQDMAISA
ncbi:helix-turn-helix domain-containing protein [Planktomarina temperata]|nr:helix-turn-helix domain-containing protein [Planktomarina temperata]